MKAVIHHTNGVEEHVDCIDGQLTLRCVAQNGDVSHNYEKRLALSEFTSITVGGQPETPKPEQPPKTEKLVISKAEYALGKDNARFAPKDLQDQTIELTIAKRGK